MGKPKNLTPAERSLRARIAVNTSWANTRDRSARTANGTASSPASLSYWEKRVDPDGEMDDATRAKAAENARSAHYQRMAYRAAQARKNKTP
ncbi:hypothetical protein [Actinomadura sediminis]|uniref:Uncharacterized protein n=1 Tax=Actinomadura sediminis TaxID=1038904 RepID=A0ABW3EPX6_9ACTN